MNTLFPIFIKPDQIQILLVGGGPIGLEKFQAIIQNNENANITVVASEICSEFKAVLLQYSHIIIAERDFIQEDLQRKHIVILATNNHELNDAIRDLATAQCILLNAADKPALCDFYLGSIVKKGNLKIAISTNGKSPTIAKRVKEFLQEMLPNEIDETLELMNQLREQLKGDFQEKVSALNKHTKSLIEKDGNY
ncbi:bifunctional precorrin-2 dehydrogenase/sirohydrochlorin ferrochelatase [Sphingobacterium sp. SG20118]|uniref:precorrin-2 dehydrogenase/sirohydrochlorin ferrochelatase family protein n=1 Tax=Sphingobacterium TaxID=28453 RepID=UPI0004F64C64|nr:MULTISPECIES: bifunctional precorrin-2 dehydrogenase/sirohydrochlorin ferrochelatase [Sphingobacterium]AIM37326.1 siroheme synthase [Sphingobacterium sp. ML3W]MDH5826583.1 bifunctional precorrin-2 dehydrogenase/sirohydrochlorin ferrochelatase [Sphingobacterium faecium]